MQLEMTCDRCSVATTCPKRGTSPLFLAGGKRVLCRILGGFGKVPVDLDILSEESKSRAEKDGPCLTLAEVPVVEDGVVTHELVKVFSPSNLSERERTTVVLGGQLNPKGF